MGLCFSPLFRIRRVVVALAVFCSSLGASATETDNFYLPLETEMADLGDFFEAIHTQALEESVRQVNSRIDRALNLKDSSARSRELALCQAPEVLAQALADQFGEAPAEVIRIERQLRSEWSREAFPGKLPMCRDTHMNFRGHFPIDPRILGTVFNSGTVRAYGVYFGTDKILHFHQLGYDYYKRFRAFQREGANPDEALRLVIQHFSQDGFFAENKFFGSMISGIYSNGDMAANYAGLKFFRNLTEIVRVAGAERAPLVVRCGVFWRVNDHVRSQSGWFRGFITDHWNEALNPNLYDWTMRHRIRRVLEDRADRIIAFYTTRDGRPSDPAYFEDLMHTLATYFGEPYGHSGQYDRLMNIGNTCYPALKKDQAGGAGT